MGETRGVGCGLEGKREDTSNSDEYEGLKRNPSEIRGKDAEEFCASGG